MNKILPTEGKILQLIGNRYVRIDICRGTCKEIFKLKFFSMKFFEFHAIIIIIKIFNRANMDGNRA